MEDINYPNTIWLNSCSEFDVIKHQNYIVKINSFTNYGKNDIYGTIWLHNVNVMFEYNQTKYRKEHPFEYKCYVDIEDCDFDIRNYDILDTLRIEVLYNGLLLDKYTYDVLYMTNMIEREYLHKDTIYPLPDYYIEWNKLDGIKIVWK